MSQSSSAIGAIAMTSTQPGHQTACATAPSAAQVEASCRLPVLFLAFSGAAWLFAGAALALVGARVLRLPEQFRAALGWAGLLGILVASLVSGNFGLTGGCP